MEVRQSLKELRDTLNRDRIMLTVLVLPWLDRYQDWPLVRKQRRDRILQVLEDLQIQHIDLLEPLNEALDKGVEVEESLGDRSHPSAEVSAFFARHFFEYDQRNRIIDNGRR